MAARLDPMALYHRLPYRARVGAASVRGAVLQRRRYGPETDRLVDEALARDQWPAARWATWHDEVVGRLVDEARLFVPAYRDLPTWASNGDVRAGLAAWPLLAKERVRSDPASFVRTDRPRVPVAEHTSGTSGAPLTLPLTVDDYRRWYALFEARCRHWYGVTRTDRWAIVGGQPVVPPTASGPPYWVWNAAMGQLYLSSYHVGRATARDYVDALDRHRVTYVVGYPSAVHALAVACRAEGVQPKPMRVVVANAEPVLPHQRAVIEAVFGAPVRETYGMAEFVAGASECDAGRLHLWPDAGVVEVVAHEGDERVPDGTAGRLVCTGLINTTMPFVRYLVGDAGALGPAGGPGTSGIAPCPCGRLLPVLEQLDGRCDDLVHLADGRVVGRLDPVFKADLPIDGAQIVQETVDRFRVLVVPAEGWGPLAADSIRDRLRDRVGDVHVDIEPVTTLPTGPNGKFQAVVSHVPPPT